jgi:multidrug efflux pump subunit AcrA (membrane-fusion protein)
MGARVAFLTTAPAGGAPSPPSTAVLVPADAVRGEGADAVVFVYASDRVERRGVTLGRSVGAEREILTGLRAGERVVVAPPPSLEDGDAVRVAEGR